jgi:hypothetical protein
MWQAVRGIVQWLEFGDGHDREGGASRRSPVFEFVEIAVYHSAGLLGRDHGQMGQPYEESPVAESRLGSAMGARDRDGAGRVRNRPMA